MASANQNNTFDGGSLAISAADDSNDVRTKYRPYLQSAEVTSSDWVSKLELDTVERMIVDDWAANQRNRIKVLVLFGSMRAR